MSNDVFTTIEAFGSTSLVEDGSNYFVCPDGSAVELSYAGAPLVDGQFDQFSGHWVLIGAEQTASGYEVAWNETGTDQYTVWYTDDSGNYLSNIGAVSGNTLESLEPSFHQDLNGDGLIGPPTAVIEANGSTQLTEVGNHFFLDDSDGSGPSLKYAGADYVAGQFGQLAPIGAEQTASGYEVAWNETGTDQYSVWVTDNNGNYLSNTLTSVSGTSAALQSIETSFQQDLNGDGTIGPPALPPPAQTVIEGFGSTSLTEVGTHFYLYGSGGTGPSLKYQGADYVAGQFGQVALIGAEQTTSGYEVAWKAPGADQFSVWNTDNNGNYLSNTLTSVSGTSAALQSFETSFHQDLNGDGTIGPPALPPPAQTVIEGFGSTSLTEVGTHFYLYGSGGTGPSLKYQGADVVAGQFGQVAPIGAEQTASGYEVAWNETGTDQYTVWYTDNNGNYLSNTLTSVSGTSAALQSIETSFQQDLNGDGLIGPPTAVIEGFGSTSLTEVGTHFYLYGSGGTGPSLKYQGADVVAGQFGQVALIGAEQTASGYEVAWKMPGADQYSVWVTDNNGNYLSNTLTSVSGTSAALQSIETSFQQDLNGDGTISPAGQVSSPHFVYQGVDANGVQLYSVTWDTLGSHPFAVRVLAPDHPSTDYAHSFLYALPVEGGLAQSTWGSGLDELRQLGVENQYDATIIEPIFPIDPWYADNSLDATIDFETFMATLLPAWVNSNFAKSGTEDDLLIGFSKSAYGALDLLFKHPAVFDAAAAWDFPADMTAYSNYGASGNYGTDWNFQNNYRLTGTFIDTWKAPFTTGNRIVISGYDVFQTEVADFDALLTSQGVLHTLSTQTYDPHSWSGGWLSDAVAGLYELDLPTATQTGPSAPAISALVGQPVDGSPIEVKGTGEAGDTVTLYADGGATPVGTGTVASDGSFDITTSTTFADGSHTLTATQTDTQGLTGTASASFAVAVDPSAPAISALVGQPVDGSPIEVTGTGEAGDTVTLYADGGATPVGTGTVASDGSFDIATSTTFADGSHTLTATQTDAQGLTSTASAGFAVAVNPTAPLITTLVGQPANGSPIEVTGTGEAGDTVTLYADGGATPVGTGTVASDGSFDIATSTTFADGSHTLTATQTDAQGLTSTASAGFAVAVNPTAPLITTLVGQPANGSAIEVKGTGAAGDTVALYADGGATPVGAGTVASDGSFDITTNATFAAGSHTLTATQIDAQGVTSAASAGFAVAVNPTAPLISALVGQPVNGSAIEVKGTGEAGDTVTLYADGGTAPVGAGTVGVNGNFDITTSVAFVYGSHTLTATQTDAQGLASTPSTGFAVAVDPTTPPSIVPPIHANDLSYSSTALGPNHFIDLRNFEASYPDLVAAFGTNQAAMQNWYSTREPIENRPETFDGLDYIASFRDLISAFGAAGSMKAMQDDGAAHYISNGETEGRTTTFNGLDYIASYSDLIKAFGANNDAGAYHYIENGHNEGRTTSFDGLDYIASYVDLIKAFGANEQAGAAHFITNGSNEGRTTTFDGLAYIAQYTDLMQAFGANNDAGATHYIQNGFSEGRSTAFNVGAYESAHPDLAGKFASNDAFLTAYINTYKTTGTFLT